MAVILIVTVYSLSLAIPTITAKSSTITAFTVPEFLRNRSSYLRWKLSLAGQKIALSGYLEKDAGGSGLLVFENRNASKEPDELKRLNRSIILLPSILSDDLKSPTSPYHCADQEVLIIGRADAIRAFRTIGIVEIYKIYALETKNGTRIQKLCYTAPPYNALPNEVKAVQILLTGLGYDPGTSNGTFHFETYKAILDFQTKFGLKQTGVVDEGLLPELSKAIPASMASH